MAAQIYPVTLLDSSQVIQYVYDETTQTLRTTATAVIIGGDLAVEIDGIYSVSNPDPDNIGVIGHVRAPNPTDLDQTNRITSITNNTVHALDISIHNSDGSAVDASNPLDTNVISSALPAGAATSALQTAGNTSLSSIDSKLVQLVLNYGIATGALRTAAQIGNDTGAALFGAGTTTSQVLRVVLPTDQTAIPVTQSTSPWLTSRNWTLSSGTDSVTAVVSNFPATQSVTQGTSPWVVSGTVTANQGTSPWVTSASQSGTWTTGRTWTLSSGTDSVNVGNFPSTFAVTQSTSPWIISGTVAATQSGTWNIATLTTITNPVAVTQSGTWSTGRTWTLSSGTDSIASVQSGSWTVTANIGTTGGLQLDTTGAALNLAQNSTTTGQTGPLIQAAVTTAAPAYTTGKTSPLSLTTTGALRVDNSANTQPISGTVTANQGTSPWIISGTVTANAGTNLNTSALALDTSVNGILRAQASTTSGQSGPLIQGATTTAAPSYTTGQTNPLSLTLAGALRTDSSATTQPISGTVAATQSGTWTTGRTWTLSSGTDSVAVTQSTSPWVISGTVTANAGTNLNTSALALESGGNLASIKTNTDNLSLAQASTTSGQKGNLVLGATTTAAPSYTTAQSNPLSLTTSGALRTDSSATTQPVSGTFFQATQPISGTVTSNQGTSPWVNNITQFGGSAVVTGTGASGSGIPRVTVSNDSTVKAQLQDNAGTAITLGQKTMSASVPVVIASDQTVTLTVIPGNPTVATYMATANFTSAALLASDVFTITGSGTKTIQVRKIMISGTNSGNTNALIQVIKRSSADSGGTSTTATNVPIDSTNAAATATVKSYTVNPTLGTAVGTIDSFYCYFPTLASTNVTKICEINYGTLRDQAVYLRGTSEQLTVNLNGITLGSVTQLSIKVEWTEE